MKVHPRREPDLEFRCTSDLECSRCGKKAEILKERQFKCTQCSGLFDMEHHYSDMSHDVVKRFKDAFRHRSSMYGRPFIDDARTRSGVWRFHELIMPNLRSDQLVTLGEGVVPIVRAGYNLRKWIGGDIDIWIIREGDGPTGSFKDFGGAAMISVAKAAGVKRIGCSSTGDTAAMNAAYAAAAGMESFVLFPEGLVTPVQLVHPGAHGSRTIELPTDFDGCTRVLKKLVELGVYPGNSLNPARIEGHKATVFLIAMFFRWHLPEWIAVPVGNGSNSTSIGKGMRQLKDLGFVTKTSRILGVQTEQANPLSKSWESVEEDDGSVRLGAWAGAYKPVVAGDTIATATRIGDPVSRDKVMREITSSNGAMQSVSEAELADCMLKCAQDGHLLCPQSGIAMAGVRRSVRSGRIKKGETVVIVSTATGLKFTPAYEPYTARMIERAPRADVDTVAKMLGL